MKARIILDLVLILQAPWHMALAQSPGTFARTGDMHIARIDHTATLLNDGRVLVAGGGLSYIGLGSWLYTVHASAELYDPATGAFGPAGDMTNPRAAHTATTLADGRVLIAGGYFHPDGTVGPSGRSIVLTSAELYDPASGTFTRTGDMTKPRRGHRAILLPDGRVLIVGLESSMEMYDPSTGTFAALDAQTARWFDAPVLLASGKVLLTAGISACGQDCNLGKGEANLYDPATGALASTGPMTSVQTQPVATLLLDGRVLLTGNAGDITSDIGGCSPPCVSSELYDPVAGSFFKAALPSTPRDGHTATLLPDGTVLLAGGLSPYGGAPPPELYNPTLDSFQGNGNMATARVGAINTLLTDGRVLFTGGWTWSTGSGGPVDLESAELYTPEHLVPAAKLYSLSGDGKGAGAILHADTHLVVSPDNPAVAGEVVEIYGSGLSEGGAIPPRVAIGGRTGEVLWFGGSPVYPGLNQINVRVPNGIVPGPAVPVRLTYLGRTSNAVTIGVQR